MPSKTWELSLYELHRTPQEAITDGTEIAVSPRSLHSELMCPICLDMLKNTMTTKECLHRSSLLSYANKFVHLWYKRNFESTTCECITMMIEFTLFFCPFVVHIHCMILL